MQEDHTKEGASLVGGHQRKRFPLSGFQERAHFSLFPLTPFLMLYSGACPPLNLRLLPSTAGSSEERLPGLSDQMKCGIRYTFQVWGCFIFIHFATGALPQLERFGWKEHSSAGLFTLPLNRSSATTHLYKYLFVDIHGLQHRHPELPASFK